MVAKLSNEQIFNLTEALNQLTQSSYIFPVKVSFIILKNLGSLAPVYNSILEQRDELVQKFEDEGILNAELRSLSEQSCEVDLYPINLKDIENEVIPISILNSLMLILAEE